MKIIKDCKKDGKMTLHLSWNVGKNPLEDAGNWINSKKNILTEDEFNKILIPENGGTNVRYLVLPIHRFGKTNEVIILENCEYTTKELLMLIYKFYNEKELTYQELKRIDDDDVHDYVNNACKNMKELNKNAKYIDIIGGSYYFEFILETVDNANDVQYTLFLGS